MQNRAEKNDDDVKRLTGIMNLYYVGYQLAQQAARATQKIAEGVYLDMDDDRVVTLAKEMGVYRALDVGAARGGVFAVAMEVQSVTGEDLDFHLFVNFTDQMADDNGFMHLYACGVIANPDRKNFALKALKDIGVNPLDVIPMT